MNEALLSLYRDGFPEDGEAYSAFFVSEYADRAVTAEADGRPVGAGYLLPKTLHFAGRTFPAYYLDAFSVLRPYRGRGVAQALMANILARAAADGVRFVFLCPFDGAYYRQYGFADVVSAENAVISGGCDFPVRRAKAADIGRVYAAMTAGADAYFVKDAAEFAGCERDHILIGGEAFAAGTVFGGVFEVTACTDYAALLRCESLRGLSVYVPGRGAPFVQVYDAENPGKSPFTGKTAIIDKL